MTPRLALTLVLGAALSAAAVAQDQSASAPPKDSGALLQSCANHKFETTVATTVDGKLRGQKVKICGVAGQTDADWKRTLEDAVKKVHANGEMAASVKEQIVTALKLEIGRLDTASAAPATGSSSTPFVTGLANISTEPVTKAPPAPVRPATPARPRPLERDYGNLKPLPAPLPPAAASGVAPTRLPALARPRFKLLCSSPYDPRATEECDDVYPSTVFTIRADETLAGGTSLRFLRKGDSRGEVTLAALQKGQVMRAPLPRGVCAGVTRGSVEIQVMRKAPTGARQVVDALGPYDLRC